MMKRALLFGSIALVANLQVIHAQVTTDSFLGTWGFSNPDSADFVLILKRNGLASYFRSDNQDRTVYQGNWELSGETAVATWSDGKSYTLENNASGTRVIVKDTSGTTLYSAQMLNIPREVLGQWAKDPVDQDALQSDRDQAKGFFGIWRIEAEPPYYVFVESNRSAASSWAGSIYNARGPRGSWARQGSELHLVWDSGHYSILKEVNRGYTYKRIQPGEIIEEDSSTAVAAVRVSEDVVPADWYADYKAYKDDTTGGIVFASRKQAREFYRGYWLTQIEPGAYERFELGRFGGLSTSRNPDLKGDWLLSGQDVFLRWDDGMRKILSPVGEGFIIYNYRPGRPLDGVPTRIYPTAPENTAKLSEYIRDRKEVAAMIAASAEEAGVELKEGNGWGRSFMRWAWPFGNESAESDAIIRDAYEDDDYSVDPWWWPFWSESAEVAAADTGAEAADPAPESVETAQPQQSKSVPNRGSKKWFWPF